MSQSIEKDRKYTYGDIEKYPENERWEIIDGVPYLQAQPSITHQRCSFELSRQFGNFLKDKPCELIPEPAVFLDLKPGEKRKTSSKYVVPDLVINCDKSKIQEEGIYGTPDLIIEVLSPSTAGIDAVKKYNQYLSAGLKEYWIVDPANSLITVFKLKDNNYTPKIFDRESKIPVEMFNNELEINLSDVFPLKVIQED